MEQKVKKSLEVIERETAALGSAAAFTRSYPLVAEEGKGSYITDVDGNRYLDLGGGAAVTAVGHCHPEVVASIKRQADKLIHNCFSETSNEVTVNLAETLIKLTPGDFAKKIVFGLSKFRGGGPLRLYSPVSISELHTCNQGPICVLLSLPIQVNLSSM